CRSLRRGAERELRLGAQRGYTSGARVLRHKGGIGGDRLVVAIRPFLTRANYERPEGVVRLEVERGARHDGRGVAAPGGGERRAAPKRRECGGLRRASTRDGRAQQKKGELLHRRDFFLTAFFLASALGLAGWTGLCLDLRGPSTSASTRSPSSGPIKPRRTA